MGIIKHNLIKASLTFFSPILYFNGKKSIRRLKLKLKFFKPHTKFYIADHKYTIDHNSIWNTSKYEN